MKKAIILSIMVMFCGVAFAQMVGNTSTFEKTNADVGVLVTRDATGKVLSAIAITKKQLEAQVAQNDTKKAEAQARITILNN